MRIGLICPYDLARPGGVQQQVLDIGRLLAAAAIEIVILWLMILALVVVFWRLDRIGGALLVPYLAWVTYAATLSVGFAVMNPG